VSNPKVVSVPSRSLSIVLGTPTIGNPAADSLAATPSVSSPPMATERVETQGLEIRLDRAGVFGLLVGVRA
jgi:hypothetical protein